MATSGVITGSMTAREIVTAAVDEIGYRDADIELQSSDAATCLRTLNWMLKSWQTQGITNLWRVQDVSITWPAATSEVTLDTNYLDLKDVRVRVSGIDRVLTRFSQSDYAEITTKAQAGAPIAYNLVKTRSTLMLRLWPVPAAETALYADGSRVVEDVSDLSQTLDIPQEWTEAVYVCLADRLPLSFKAGLSPIERAELKARAEGLYATLRAHDDETGSVFFGVDL